MKSAFIVFVVATGLCTVAAAGPLNKQDRQQTIGDRLHQQLAPLNLPPEQESQIIDSMRTAHEQIRTIRRQVKVNLSTMLTAEQRSQLKQIRGSMRKN